MGRNRKRRREVTKLEVHELETFDATPVRRPSLAGRITDWITFGSNGGREAIQTMFPLPGNGHEDRNYPQY